MGSTDFEPTPAAMQIGVDTRRRLHRFPELSFEEHSTSQYVREQLDELGIPYRSGFAGTGIVAVLDAGRPGPVTGFRADMDALPLIERTDLPFASVNAEVMHACGHDMHTGILLGLAAQLVAVTERLRGKIVFIFQPGEESNGGAQRVIDDGGLQNPGIDRIFALHVAPGIPTGTVAVRASSMTATDDEFRVLVRGQSAHSSEPNQGVNAVLVAASIASALTQIPASIDPFSVATLTLASIHGGDAINVIPDSCELTGMIRAVSESDKFEIRDKIKRTVTGCAAAQGAVAELIFTEGYPPVVNDDECAALVHQAALRVVSSGVQVITPPRPHLGSEDFAYYQRAIPGALFMLGCTGVGSGETGLHTSEFVPDEEAIKVGIRVFTSLAHLTNGLLDAD